MRRKPLGRWGKIGRNVLLTLLAGVLIWLIQGAPPLTAEGELRRLERESFLTGHAQFQGSFSSDSRSWALGLTQDWVVFGDLKRNQLSFWPREGDGPVLAPAPDGYGRRAELCVAALNAPEGTASARLTATLSCWYTHTSTGGRSTWSYWAAPDQDWGGLTPVYWEKTYTLEGEPLDAGAFVFRLEPVPESNTIEFFVRDNMVNWTLYQSRYYVENPNQLDVSCTMTAVFYDSTGGELGRAELKNAGAADRS